MFSSFTFKWTLNMIHGLGNVKTSRRKKTTEKQLKFAWNVHTVCIFSCLLRFSWMQNGNVPFKNNRWYVSTEYVFCFCFFLCWNCIYISIRTILQFIDAKSAECWRFLFLHLFYLVNFCQRFSIFQTESSTVWIQTFQIGLWQLK